MVKKVLTERLITDFIVAAKVKERLEEMDKHCMVLDAETEEVSSAFEASWSLWSCRRGGWFWKEASDHGERVTYCRERSCGRGSPLRSAMWVGRPSFQAKYRS